MSKKIDGEFNELAIFYIDRLMCGIDIKEVQEIKRIQEVTVAYGAPDYVRGVVNLRGQIVSIIDLRIKFGYEKQHKGSDTERIMVVPYKDEQIGLVVDRVDDVIMIDPAFLLPAPSNVPKEQSRFFKNVYQTNNGLVSIIDYKSLLDIDEEQE